MRITDTEKASLVRGETPALYIGGGKAHFQVPSTLGPCVIGHSAVDLLASDKPGFTKAEKVWFRHGKHERNELVFCMIVTAMWAFSTLTMVTL